jgi:hypothetical protein
MLAGEAGTVVRAEVVACAGEAYIRRVRRSVKTTETKGPFKICYASYEKDS